MYRKWPSINLNLQWEKDYLSSVKCLTDGLVEEVLEKQFQKGAEKSSKRKSLLEMIKECVWQDRWGVDGSIRARC
jgi:hypothetical protein